MNRTGFSTQKLVHDVQGLIAQLKRIFFTDKKPIDDDETDVHKLCVRLENILRYGLREKYTFLGVRKDYWNFLYDCLSKDETVKFINSLPDFKSFQGKGRALLRQALMEKTLADTLQRCVINDRVIREYYINDSVLRSEEHLQSLVHSLYDLNAVDFNLPYKGYDLDRGWPSFSRKSFMQRKSSSASVVSTDVQDGPDPLVVLHGKVTTLNQAVVMCLKEDEGKQRHSLLKEEPSMQNVIETISVIQESITKIQVKNESEISHLQKSLQQVKEEKIALERDSEMRIKQLNDRQMKLLQQDSKSSSDQMRDLYDKLLATQKEVTELKTELAVATERFSEAENKASENLSMMSNLEHEKKSLSEQLALCREELLGVKQAEQTKESSYKVLEMKMAEIQKLNASLEKKEKDLSSQLQSNILALGAKDEELSKAYETFEKSSGAVVGSVKELGEEIAQQLKQQSQAAKDVQDHDSRSLQVEKSDVMKKLEIAEQKCMDEIKRREDLEKTVAELKSKLTEHLKHDASLQSVIDDICKTVHENVSDETDLPSDFADGLKSKLKKEKEEALKKLFFSQQTRIARDSKARQEAEEEAIALKYELAQISKNFTELQEKLRENDSKLNTGASDLEKKCESLEEECKKLQLETERCHEEMFNLSLNASKYQEESSEKEKQCDQVNCALRSLQNEVTKLEEDKRHLEEENDNLKTEISDLKIKLQEQELQWRAEMDRVNTEKDLVVEMLEGTSEKKISEEQQMCSMKEELEVLKSTKEQEVQGLMFQLSTEEMKHQSAVKALSEATAERDEAVNALEQERNLMSEMKEKQLAENTTWIAEKEGLVDQNSKLDKELATNKERLAISEKEVMFLKVELEKLSKEKDEEKSKRQTYAEKFCNLKEEKKSCDEKYRSQIAQLETDCQELKDNLVNAIKDKQDLWKKSEILEFEVKQKSEERWVKDDEVASCSNCKEAFSITVRKHHCRLCGQIFCHSCSNKWLETPHSRRKVRSCDLCASLYSQTHGRCETDGNMSDVSNLSERLILDASMSEDDPPADRKLSTHPEDFEDGPAVPDEDLSTDAFEILDPAEVSNMGSFGEEENFVVAESDIKMTALLPTICDDDEMMREKQELQLAAGDRCILPVVVGSNKVDLVWEFSSYPKDVGFGVAYKKDESTSDSEVETVIPLCRYISHKQTIYGQAKVERPGVYFLIFNNSYSRLTSKTVTCLLGLQKSKPAV